MDSAQSIFGPLGLFFAVLASLLAVAKLDNLTAAMGILGAIAGYLFGAEAKESPSTNTSTGVNASGAQVGDNARIAGRDINDTVNNIERMLGDIQGLTNTTIQSMQLLNDTVAKAPLLQRRTERFRWESSNPSFVAELKSLSRSGVENWSQRWIEMCLEQPACQTQIREVIESGRHSGWEPREIDFDNHGDGIHVNLKFARELLFLRTAQ